MKVTLRSVLRLLKCSWMDPTARVLVPWFWEGNQEFAFLTSSQVMLM